MNPWRRTPLTKNPYTRTAFRVGRVPREIVRRRTLVQVISQTENVIKQQAHIVNGVAVTPAELNVARHILLDPQQRIVEELLEHASEKLPLKQVRKLAAEIAAAMTPDNVVTPLPLTNRRVLGLWQTTLVEQFLHFTEAPDPSFGAGELEIAPPFGRPGEKP